MKTINTLIALALCLAFANSAYALSEKRGGINFGLGLRMINDEDSSLAGDQTNKNSHTTSEVQGINPYVGYAFLQSFNIGLAGLYQTGSTKATFTDDTNKQQTEQTTDSTLKAMSLFVRFMFAKFMYFEGGGGVYQRSLHVSNTYTSNQGDGIFNGKREDYTVNGMGPGYHFAVGLEINVVNGFFFTSNYTVRNFILHDNNNGGIGRKRSDVQQRELAFGIAHYVN